MKLCENHDYQVPLISTFVFNGAEYWCPYCGHTTGMFESGEKVKQTEKLIGRLQIYKDYSDTYLDAIGTLVCCARKFKGIKIDRKDFSENMLKELRDFVKGRWKYKIRATKLLQQKLDEYPDFSCDTCIFEKECKKAWSMKELICKKWKREIKDAKNGN